MLQNYYSRLLVRWYIVSTPQTPYNDAGDKLLEVISGLHAGSSAATYVQKAIDQTPISLDEEMSLNEQIIANSLKREEKAEKLVNSFLFAAILAAYDYRGHGIGLEELIEVAVKELEKSALLFVPKRLSESFYGCVRKSVHSAILERFSELKILGVSLDELQAAKSEAGEVVDLWWFAIAELLDPREQEILRFRLGLSSPFKNRQATVEEIAKFWGGPPERIEEITTNGLKKIKRKFEMPEE